MNGKTKRTTTTISAKSSRYYPTTAKETQKAVDAYHAARLRAGKPVPTIH
jgi:hypothetical protein